MLFKRIEFLSVNFPNYSSCELKLSQETLDIAQKFNFEVRGYSFDAKPGKLIQIEAIQNYEDSNLQLVLRTATRNIVFVKAI